MFNNPLYAALSKWKRSDFKLVCVAGGTRTEKIKEGAKKRRSKKLKTRENRRLRRLIVSESVLFVSDILTI